MHDPNIFDAEKKDWLEQLEVTGPIKGIMDFVDELSQNYDRRLAALHVEYQKDIEEVLACYKEEKQEFHMQLEELRGINAGLEQELGALQQNYKTVNIEYKITQDSLSTAREELSSLTKALKNEAELMDLMQQRIAVANEQIRMELANRGVEPAPEVPGSLIAVAEQQVIAEAAQKTRKFHFRRTREFFQQVIADRLTRPIIIRPKQEPILTDKFEEQGSL